MLRKSKPVAEEAVQEARQRATCSAVERQLMLMIEAMRDDVAQNRKILHQLLKGAREGPEYALPAAVKSLLPIASMEDVENIELSLQDTAVETAMIAYLHETGGGSTKEIVRRIMRIPMTTELATQFTC
ncbi:PREDICTED: uncharacterized protein LOC106815139 [Priapulus caudatus]|uniref:Uncharacterized protein LOC106815139 n=1 Tax=Priapulus caudatus TaxID=37621 RepID=A0ABM1ES87_PRICU|nr:PREDICTED: uncharacterized protein LOC106815139 [Priapulus caudatus]